MQENEPHRDYKLAEEINTLVLRLVQLRDTHQHNIRSVKCEDYELDTLPNISGLDIGKLSIQEKKSLCKHIGYKAAKRTYKCDIVINGERYAIRCLNYTDRPLVNHSTRPKFEKVCQWLNLPIADLDLAVTKYIERRKLGLFNEDCYYQSTLNPFVAHRNYLKKLLTAMAFNSFNFEKEYYDKEFVKDSVAHILDFIDPLEPTLWRYYSPKNYFDAIWTSLCFSLRDNKGMPSDEELFSPGNESILKWNFPYEDKFGVTRNKAALHIRVKKYDAIKLGTPFEEKFQAEIKEIKQNKGDRDEYILKLFLIECRQKSLSIPIGETTQIVRTVGSRTKSYGNLAVWMDWKQLEPEELISLCASVYVTKASQFEKADVFVNGIGISVKSERGGKPSIINHTTREKILRVMNSINAPIAPLDSMVNRYWELRLSRTIREDTCISDHDCPFSHPDEITCFNVLKPLINYFAFDGTGAKDSIAPAQFILSLIDPTDIQTWTYYDKNTFIFSVWKRLVFSLREKETPVELDETKEAHRQMKPWVRFCEGSLKGALSVRVSRKK